MKKLLCIAYVALCLTLSACGNSGGDAGGSKTPSGGTPAASGASATDATYVELSGKSTLVLKPDNTFTMDTSKKQHITGTYKIAGEMITLDGKGDDAKTVAMTVTGSIRGDEVRLQFGPTEQVLKKK